MMNFMEAVQAMTQGKKVRRSHYVKGAYLYLDKVGYKYWDETWHQFGLGDFERTDWEILEEKKSLSDKHKRTCPEEELIYHEYIYYEKDIKESLKEFIGWLPIDVSRGRSMDKAKEIFGDRLI